MMKTRAILIILLISFFMSRPGYAEVEYWQAFDFKVPVTTDYQGSPTAFHIFTLAQLAPRHKGLGFVRFSSGPIWRFSQNFSLAMHGDLIGIRHANNSFINETRFDLEPIFKGSWSKELNWLNRNSIEYRIFPSQQRIRLRSLLRINFKMATYPWTPYMANEIFVEFPQGYFNQNRTFGGISYNFSEHNRLDMGYMFRIRKNANEDWSQDHIFMLFLFY